MNKKAMGVFRAINKHTKDFVEIPMPNGMGTDFRLSLLDIAFAWTDWHPFLYSGEQPEKPEFHYYAIYTPGFEDQAICGIGLLYPPEFFEKYGIENAPAHMSITVNLDTNELEPDKKQQAQLEAIGITDIYEYIDKDKLM